MNKVLIIAVIPPLIVGGVSIYLDRFINLFAYKVFHLKLLDLKKERLCQKDN